MAAPHHSKELSAHMPLNSPTITLHATWRVMVVVSAMTIGSLLAVVHFGVRHALAPSLAPWALGAGLLLALPSLLAPTPGRLAGHQAVGAAARAAVTKFITACSLAELPALAGAIYYLFGGEPRGTALLVLVSVALLARLRPAR